MFNKHSIKKIKAVLTNNQETVAVAESVTADFLQASLASAQDARLFYQGGLTAYDIGQKSRHLDVGPIHALNCNCVSPRIAEDIAKSICREFASHWSLGVTGYASPVPESGNKQFAYYAISLKSEIKLADKVEAESKDPLATQLYFADCILAAFARILHER